RSDAGHPSSPDMMRRIMTTLEALATYGEQPEAPQAGRLTADVDPPGFEALAALVPRGAHATRSAKSEGTHAPPRVIPFNQPKREPPRRKAGNEKDEARRREAERRAQETQARKELHAAERARAAMRDAAARAKAAEKAKAALEARFEKLSATADAARQDARRVASEAEEAAQAVDDAERAVTNARAKLDD